MSEPFEEILSGRTFTRPAPGARHELICSRLHALVNAIAANLPHTQLLAARTAVRVSFDNTFRPDMSLVTTATGKLWLAAEIVGVEDHRIDTVAKKEIYEATRVPRLWMIDPRYDNVEIYHATPHGLMLQGIFAGNDSLTEKLLPAFQLTVAQLFASDTPA